ncbi:hypothetical protein [Flammeovirga kamogawensis]|uniref:Lipoprotein n=1 Tax=Flammeovirga kamogawensis TaxID=373891 RepID=A0ABX8GW88_9BACT|nr:hypothetical protein [Flammeovirga kamogawensis]MBB6461026.1 hypothetical protein [Flammeovirga kamogawensis]QWG07596.1 hypothetical protein KM029_01260 [Flammeovirga kamogawensis]TRX69408.1 hypothetical protein EO216_15200 [Flammeovirga kamogawensis]
MTLSSQIRQLGKVALACGLATTLIACGGSNDSSKDEAKKEIAAQKATNADFNIILNNAPEPTDIPVLLERSGADFDATLLNSKDKAQSYTISDVSSALNFGVYVSDIAYLSAFDKAQEAIDYFNAAKKLSDKIGVTQAMGKDLNEKLESALSDKEAMLKVISDSESQVKAFLNTNSQYDVAALIVTGTTLEGLHISLGLVNNAPKDLPEEARNALLVDLMSSIAKQSSSVDAIVTILAPLKDGNEAALVYYNEFVQLQKAFKNLHFEEKLKDNKGTYQLKAEDLRDITEKVEKIRKMTVSN